LFSLNILLNIKCQNSCSIGDTRPICNTSGPDTCDPPMNCVDAPELPNDYGYCL